MKKIVLLMIVLVLVIGCDRAYPNPDTHTCFEITCCKSGYISLVEPKECKDESYNWDEEGVCALGEFGGCSNFEKKDFWFEEYNELSGDRDRRMLDDLNWRCIEWANKTTVNPEYFENCCINLDVDLIGGMTTNYNMTVDEETKLNVKFTNEQSNTLYKGGGICFDGNDDFKSVNIGKQTVSMAKCLPTPRMIDTNETICITKTRR